MKNLEYNESQRRIKIRNELAEAQNGLCGICGQAMTDSTEFRDKPSIDHVLPISAGGMDCLGNWICVHQRCNWEKSNRMPNGCELVNLLAVNCRMGVEPMRW